MRTLRTILWGMVILVGGLALALVVSGDVRDRMLGDREQGVAAIGGPFTMVDSRGEPVSQDDLAGRPSVIFFGFTHCPDVCPTTLFEMTRWLEALGADADRLTPVFVTVDPERDTPELMDAYLSSFDERIVGLTGTPEQVAEIAGAYRVYYRKVDTEGGDYTMDHTASIYLMDGRGRFVGTIAYGEADDVALEKLRRLARAG